MLKQSKKNFKFISGFFYIILFITRLINFRLQFDIVLFFVWDEFLFIYVVTLKPIKRILIYSLKKKIANKAIRSCKINNSIKVCYFCFFKPWSFWIIYLKTNIFFKRKHSEHLKFKSWMLTTISVKSLDVRYHKNKSNEKLIFPSKRNIKLFNLKLLSILFPLENETLIA